MWITRNSVGVVIAFGDKPEKDKSGIFWAKSYADPSCVYLGRRPKLGFKLKRGECKKVNLKFELTEK